MNNELNNNSGQSTNPQSTTNPVTSQFINNYNPQNTLSQPSTVNPTTTEFMSQSSQMNGQSVNAQYNGQAQNNNISGNGLSNVNQVQQQVVQPVNQQSNFNQPYQQNTPIGSQFANQYPNYNEINNYNNKDKKGNKKTLFIIGGIILLLVVIIVIVLLIIRGNNSTKNEYEDDNPQVSDNENITGTKTNFMGFEFNNLEGFDYSKSGDTLSVVSDEFYIVLTVIQCKFNDIKQHYKEFISEFESSGYTVNNSTIQTISGSEMITYQFTREGINGYLFIIKSSNSNYVYEGFSFNRQSDYNTNSLETAVKIANNSKYTGDYSDYSTNFNNKINIDDVLED